MTFLDILDPYDAQRVRRADGVLRTFNETGVLAAADLHVARRLGELGGEADPSVLLAAALTVRALRQGSVCIEPAEVALSTAVEGVEAVVVAALPWPAPAAWSAALERSPLVAAGPDGPSDRPLRFVDGLLYLDRYWRQERCIADMLDEAAARTPPAVDGGRLQEALARLFPAAGPDRQRLAAVVAAHRWVSVLAGGPGTGKTTTVAKLLAVLADRPGVPPRIALAAPTGKAAARLGEAVAEVTGGLTRDDRDRLGALTASTLHRLLGWKPGSRGRFRHDRHNRLPFDVVVVDEASMVSLTLMSRLVEAVRSDCRLVLVGDPDQLASVEAGAVLGDLVARSPATAPAAPPAPLTARDLPDLDDDERVAALDAGVVRLSLVHRFSGGIKDLAEAVRAGDAASVLAILDAAPPGVAHVDADAAVTADLGAVREDAVMAGTALADAAASGAAEESLHLLERHRLLCAHRKGAYGVEEWGRRVEEWLRDALPGYGGGGRWYVGRPLLVTANDYQARLFNGDTGVVLDVAGAPRAAFRRDGVVDLLPVSRLADVQTVHAMSVHRSQGSQFDRVSLVLPPADSPLLTRELLYTAVTRAKEQVRIIGPRAAVAAAVARPIRRASGLRPRRD